MTAAAEIPQAALLWRKAHAEFGAALRARAAAVREDGSPDSPQPLTDRIDERFVQAVWHDQFLKADRLRTASGKRLEVIEPGRWNTSGRGPDFLDARLRLAGEEITGAVEIHLRSADWVNHGHHQDFEYNPVVLHVSLSASDDRPYEQKQNGQRLERLILEPVLDPDLETLRRTVNPDDYPYGRPEDLGICSSRFLSLPEPEVRAFLLAAGRARLEDKIARFRAQLASASFDQVLYQSLMVGQGFAANKTLYFLLSKRVPVQELLDYGEDIPPEDRADLYLSALLHVAQLFPTQSDFFQGMDAESRACVERLERHWRTIRGYFTDRLMPPSKRWHSGMRPPGFPGRRLAAVALSLRRLHDPAAPLFQVFLNALEQLPVKELDGKGWKQFLGAWIDRISVDGERHYFATHYSLGGKPCRAQALLGRPAAESLLFNVLLPMAIVKARQDKRPAVEAACWRALEVSPALADNSVTRFMTRRLFADSGREKALLRTELAQQALFKIFQDCCAQNERTCQDCTFLNAPFRPLSE